MDAAQPHASYLGKKYFPNLDGLRFICIAMVLWHHCTPEAATHYVLSSRGFLGVDFFFVLSGFLITTLLLREENQFGKFSIRYFYLRRALRILPVYFLVITCVGFYYIFFQNRTEYLDQWPYYYLFLSNFLKSDISLLAPTWSLSVEEQFYVVWPLILLIVPFNRLIIVTLALITVNVLIAIGAFGQLSFETETLNFKMFTATYAPLFIGALLAIALHWRPTFLVLWRFLSKPGMDSFACLALVFSLLVLPENVRGLPNLAIHTIMAAIIATIVIRDRNTLHHFFQSRFVSRFGQVSYGIYLYHLIALHIVTKILEKTGVQSDWVLLIFYSLLSYAIAEVSFKSFESWFLRYRPRVQAQPA